MVSKWAHGSMLLGTLLTTIAVGSLIGHSADAAEGESPHVGPQIETMLQADWIQQDHRFTANSGKRPVAAAPTAVTTRQDASGGCDGVKNGRWGFHTASDGLDPWWQVDLGADVRLDRVVLFNRTDNGCAPRNANIRILIAKADSLDQFTEIYRHDGTTFLGVKENKPLVVPLTEKNVTGRIVRLHVPGPCSFTLDEVEVFAANAPDKNIALGKPADQNSVSQHSHPGTPGTPSAVAAASGGAFSPAHTAEVLHRAEALAVRLSPTADPARLQPLRDELHALKARLDKAANTPAVGFRQAALHQAARSGRGLPHVRPVLRLQRRSRRRAVRA